MSFEDVSYLELGLLFWTICAILVETLLWNKFVLGPEVQEMSFKDISYLEL